LQQLFCRKKYPQTFGFEVPIAVPAR
jgi:hypothetical protein